MVYGKKVYYHSFRMSMKRNGKMECHLFRHGKNVHLDGSWDDAYAEDVAWHAVLDGEEVQSPIQHEMHAFDENSRKMNSNRNVYVHSLEDSHCQNFVVQHPYGAYCRVGLLDAMRSKIGWYT